MRSRARHERGVRFSVFEFDTESFLLYKRGAEVGLEAQPAQLLGLLLARPGEIVSRQEIQQAFWPKESPDDDCVKDRINHAVRRIREVLHDRQDDPQFIETIPKRGYKFILAVQPASALGTPPTDVTHSDHGPLVRGLAFTFVGKSLVNALRGKKALIAITVCALASLFGVRLLVGTRVHLPVITYVSPIRPRPDQTIIIRGHGLGHYSPYSHTDSPYLAIRDNTVHWAAGRIMERNFDDVMLTVTRWTDSEIVVTSFTGMYGHANWKLNPGDAIEVAVWNPQTGVGPAKFHLRVSDSDIQRKSIEKSCEFHLRRSRRCLRIATMRRWRFRSPTRADAIPLAPHSDDCGPRT